MFGSRREALRRKFSIARSTVAGSPSLRVNEAEGGEEGVEERRTARMRPETPEPVPS